MSDSRPVSSPSRWTRRRIIGLAVLLLVVAGIAWLALRPAAKPGGAGGGRPGAGGRPNMAAAMANLAVPVRVASAVTQDIDIFLKSLGTVTAYNTVTVRSRVSGELVDVPFKEGQQVKAGDLLAQVDPRAFQVALDQARGTQMQNLALLENARRDLQRYQALFKQDSIAKQQVDTQAALVRQYEGTIKSDQANVDNARLQLDYARITAPISGRLGLRQVDRGNLVSSSDTNGLVVITQTQPISVVFTLPETQLPEVRAELAQGRTLAVEAYDRADTRRIASGTLETLDNQIDVTTGTLKLKARFDNQDDALFPNQFVNVRLHVLTRKGVTAIPTAAVQQGSAGAFVFLVQPDNTVQVRQVKLGAINNGMVAVNEGLQPGDRVVTEGTDRLRAGAKVEVVGGDEVIPAAKDKSLGGGAPAGTTPATR
ncbi:efflux transporter periplasmic adaptor subunit [Achromobacter xylosoxidans]|uniref:MdtA/MuxA family multidrug efflux RND transporter periplasmic adaptor subunit n=1 Tax=Achromobacter ruhlandii TaxID=72557 RepID=A0A1D8I469_9BURK|nr:MdtA/MuxA family multidrug efflux RND transporter periplasmic adaptor subunit [Achromobacter ruhlandii]AKP88061.1 putative Co/Zn/Cd efflux system membrane fusion protein [Achromobacter xylosoxidans]ALX82206.1 efflux transporter periplasmic adaptor subunit [Achromobacter denitrificans]AMG43809.1 multidrug transporter subunit MdtA [Achromobacter xylosoxidans]AOU91251.1 multidrug efflux system subunit MdtA [Achromobacter ruhlandii]MCZ8435574.1 MdtA/MuxA family multidrug efflux RND transporter 